MVGPFHNPHNLPREKFEQTFPGLKESQWSVTSEGTPYYNCIAFAAGDHFNWWEPRGYWPIADKDYSVDCYTKAFATLDYQPCASEEYEEGFEKVALFAAEGKTKHAARQMPDGSWKSKCGRNQDIVHELRALEGDLYGRVVRVLKRPAKQNTSGPN